MTELTIINHKGTLVADSREVAEMVGKEHKNLLADIRGYVAALEKGGELNFQPTNFFIESTYISDQNKELPCYLLTKKGCDMVANKMTGEKGVRFTAMYIDRFYEMEHALTAPKALSPLELFAQSVAAMQAIEAKQQEQAQALAAVNQRVDAIGDIVALNPNDWRRECKNMIVRIAEKLGGAMYIRDVQCDIYKLLLERFSIDVKRRLTNKRQKAADEGMCRSKRDKLSYLDVIAEDKRAIEAYVQIVKEMAIKYGVDKEAAVLSAKGALA